MNNMPKIGSLVILNKGFTYANFMYAGVKKGQIAVVTGTTTSHFYVNYKQNPCHCDCWDLVSEPTELGEVLFTGD